MIANALIKLAPNAQWKIVDDQIEWLSPEIEKPSDAEIQKVAAELRLEHERFEYKRQRAREYPPITDYLDGVVKGDQAQIDAYIAACQAVKAKYPKP